MSKAAAHHSYSLWRWSFFVELKPDIGDDYPAVLRQVKGYRSRWGYDGASRCVVARRHSFEQVTWEQVQKIFAASGITLLAEDEIQAAGSGAADQR